MGRASRGKRARSVPGSVPVVPRGEAVGATGQEMSWQQACAHVRQLREDADRLERLAVVTARRKGLSWDAISVLLGGKPTGERLRQRFGTKPDR